MNSEGEDFGTNFIHDMLIHIFIRKKVFEMN